MIFKFALRNIFRHKARSLITLSTIIFGCIALIFVDGFFDDTLHQMRDGYINAQTGHLQVYKSGFNRYGRIDPDKYYIDNYKEVMRAIGQIPEVESITPRVQFSGIISTGENSIAFFGQGINPHFEKTIPVEEASDLKKLYDSNGRYAGWAMIDSGKGLDDRDQYSAILGRGLASTMDVKPGATVTLLTNTVNGSTNALDMKVKGTFYTFSKDFDDYFLRIPFTTAQKLLDTEAAQSLVIQLHNTEDTDTVKERLLEMFKAKHWGLEIKTWEELNDYYNKTVTLFGKFDFIMRVVISIVVMLGIFNTMNMAVLERTSEIGTLMAMGNRRSTVLKLFLAEGMLLGFTGGFLGIIIGSIVVRGIASIGILMPPPPSATMYWLSHPSIVPGVLTFSFFLSGIMGGISSLYPAYKASRLVIIQALRYR